MSERRNSPVCRALTATPARSTGNQAGWYVLGIISLFGVILGRTICGWLCPLGLIQELLHKIPTPKIKKSRITRVFTWLKYILLAVFVVALPLWYGLEHNMPLPGFCKYICPAGTFEGAMGLLSNPANTPKFAMLGILFTRKFIIMLGIGLLCIFCYRSFCRFICPLGAIYGFFNRFNVVGVKVDESRCNHCGSCVRSCGMDVRHVGDHECINCGKCMEVCAQKAISIKAGSYTLKAPEGGCADDTERSEASRKHFAKIFWGVALGVLCAALLWFNFLDPTVRKRSAQKPVPTPPAAAATAAPAESSEAAPACPPRRAAAAPPSRPRRKPRPRRRRPPLSALRATPLSAMRSGSSWPISKHPPLTAESSISQTIKVRSSSSTSGAPTAPPVYRSCRNSKSSVRSTKASSSSWRSTRR